MPKYSKPSEVFEAWKWNPEVAPTDLPQWLLTPLLDKRINVDREGNLDLGEFSNLVRPGDYVVWDEHNRDLHQCDWDTFEDRYELVPGTE